MIFRSSRTAASPPVPAVPGGAVTITSGGTLSGGSTVRSGGVPVHSGGRAVINNGGQVVSLGGGAVPTPAPAQSVPVGNRPTISGGVFPGGVATGVIITSGGSGGVEDFRGIPAQPRGETLVQDWGVLAQELRDGKRALAVQYGWAVKASPEDREEELDSLMARAWSRTAQEASWEDVKPLIDAGLERGASLYLTAAGRATLEDLTDPAKLRAWLDLGGDPSAPHLGKPMWWRFVARGHLDLLEVLRTSPAWSRWSRVHDGAGRSVMNHWAEGVDPERTPDVLQPTLATTLAVFDWLTVHAPVPDGPIEKTAVHTLLSRALKEVDRQGDPTTIVKVSAATVWDALVRDHLDAMPTARLEDDWATWNNAVRRVKNSLPNLYNLLGLPIEKRQLRDVAHQASGSTHGAPGVPRRRL